jgi:hypothetical protein
MVFLGNTNLPSSVVLFVDVLVGLHLLALAFFFVKLSAEVVMKKTRKIQREE